MDDDQGGTSLLGNSHLLISIWDWERFVLVQANSSIYTCVRTPQVTGFPSPPHLGQFGLLGTALERISNENISGVWDGLALLGLRAWREVIVDDIWCRFYFWGWIIGDSLPDMGDDNWWYTPTLEDFFGEYRNTWWLDVLGFEMCLFRDPQEEKTDTCRWSIYNSVGSIFHSCLYCDLKCSQWQLIHVNTEY